ncbi:DNA-dependent metalloprotease SPRTN isoform X1 [Hydra vulgaris]|uniref:Protein with SprT-like domain at the N terminus n=1 Tax=Hydra vulgaris TaxID=6087 RepID=T2M6A5_HYDVU|nr:DNA-dependent metalloprotease SPRTN [Hydra vulgaris]
MEDLDFILALQLSDSFLQEPFKNNEKPLSIVDPAWELIDPIPDIRDLFVQFDSSFFEGKLAGVEVKWSSRMTLCAGLCCYERKGGLCSIKLSQPLLKLRPRKDLVETLLHEMIHALLFVTDNNKDHDGHGDEFHKHMYRINKQTGTKISVYHTFHDEVNNYRQHWWKCDGPCNKRPPYFGVVRRAMNRAPSTRDTWWTEHATKCGGSFIKIKEPDSYTKGKSKKEKMKKSIDLSNQENIEAKNNKLYDWLSTSNNTSNNLSKRKISFSANSSLKDLKIKKTNSLQQTDKKAKLLPTSDVSAFAKVPIQHTIFSGKGYTISSLDDVKVANKQTFLDTLESKMKANSQQKNKISNISELGTNKDIILIDNDEMLVECPACPAKLPEHLLNAHLDICLKID